MSWLNVGAHSAVDFFCEASSSWGALVPPWPPPGLEVGEGLNFLRGPASEAPLGPASHFRFGLGDGAPFRFTALGLGLSNPIDDDVGGPVWRHFDCFNQACVELQTCTQCLQRV
jgi:hypothetical protein